MGAAENPRRWKALRKSINFFSRWGLIIAGLLAAALGLALLGWITAPDLFSFIDRQELESDIWLALGLIIGGFFTANCSRALQIWSRLKPVTQIQPAKRVAAQHRIADQGFRELFTYLFTALTTLTALTFLSDEPGVLPWPSLKLHNSDIGVNDASIVQVSVLIGCLLVSLVPLILVFFLQARAEREAFDREILRSDAVPPSSFWLGTALLAGIIALAVWAGKVSANEKEGVEAGLSYWITFAVVALFVAFIFLPHIQRYIDQLADNEQDPTQPKASTPLLVGAPAIAASWIDSLMVRLIAPLTGATQHGPLVPHGFVVLSLLPLTALGFVLPQPFGLVPIGLGALMIFALGRRWAWIEEDRELASRLLRTDAREIQIGFENDLKDEALLGYAFLFILVPLALHQINGVAGAFTGTDGNAISNPFFAWLSFFGGELAKAVPFVDWWEIYNVNIDTPIIGDAPVAKHLTFAARAMVDLVIMAALLQAIGIWQRSRAQDRLYDAGQVDAFDPFTEEHFFRRGMKKGKDGHLPRKKFEERIEKHLELRRDLGLPKNPYNPFRLGELLRHPDKEISDGALWMLEHFNILAGTPLDRLMQLSQQWYSAWYFGTAESPAISTQHEIEQKAWRRFEKLRLESLLAELVDDEKELIAYSMKRDDIAHLMTLVALSGSAVEFHFARVLCMELLSQAPHPSAFWALAAQVCPTGDSFENYREVIGSEFGEAVQSPELDYLNSRHGRSEMRSLCYRAILDHSHAYEDGDLMLNQMLEFLMNVDASGEALGAELDLRRAITILSARVRRSRDH